MQLIGTEMQYELIPELKIAHLEESFTVTYTTRGNKFI